MSNVNEGVSLDSLPNGQVCIYKVEVEDNEDNSELLELELNTVENAYLGVDLVQQGGKRVDFGFLTAKNCSVTNNCTINMRGKHVFYLSGVQTLFLTVVSTGGPRNTTAVNMGGIKPEYK
jgi:hypothetical protein